MHTGKRLAHVITVDAPGAFVLHELLESDGKFTAVLTAFRRMACIGGVDQPNVLFGKINTCAKRKRCSSTVQQHSGQ